ncbi:hypothetical protein PCE31106_03095 [Pandoraea cepalis]|uniref:DUF2061 domain-containing protein n=1 Tax=Pandoraea cepalis TaxID=2508294 RepID=A0A5E4W7B3_9BURK|nr:hypothetical protein PCE31106_03095 [Pandoraea cepalis]
MSRPNSLTPSDDSCEAVLHRTLRRPTACLDFGTLYLLTGTIHTAVGFMIISNIYTSVGYLAHERLWARIKWGIVET